MVADCMECRQIGKVFISSISHFPAHLQRCLGIAGLVEVTGECDINFVGICWFFIVIGNDILVTAGEFVFVTQRNTVGRAAKVYPAFLDTQ
jgi:hypothetical protein